MHAQTNSYALTILLSGLLDVDCRIVKVTNVTQERSKEDPKYNGNSLHCTRPNIILGKLKNMVMPETKYIVCKTNIMPRLYFHALWHFQVLKNTCIKVLKYSKRPRQI